MVKSSYSNDMNPPYRIVIPLLFLLFNYWCIKADFSCINLYCWFSNVFSFVPLYFVFWKSAGHFLRPCEHEKPANNLFWPGASYFLVVIFQVSFIIPWDVSLPKMRKKIESDQRKKCAIVFLLLLFWGGFVTNNSIF